MVNFDNSGTVTALAASAAFNLAITNQPDRFLIAGIGLYPDSETVSAVSYNSVALTQIGAINSGGNRIELWGLINPASGTNQLSATFSGSCSHIVGAASYYGAHQSTPTDGFASGGATGANASLTLTAGELAFAMFAAWATGGTPNGGQNERYSGFENTNDLLGAGADKAAGGTIGWTISGGGTVWVMAGCRILPAVANVPMLRGTGNFFF